MQIKVTRKIFFNGAIVQPGTILNLKGNSVPVWGKAISKEPQTQKQNTNPQPIPQEPQSQDEPSSQENQTQPDNTQQKTVEVPVDSENSNANLEGKIEFELAQILDTEITKAVEKNIMIEDLDKKSVIEQIIEIRTKLAEQEA